MKATDRVLAQRWSDGECSGIARMPVPSRGSTEWQLEQLKERLLRPFLEHASQSDPAFVRQLRWAANEAAALAWFTTCPILVLPVLLEEKVSAALRHWEKQARLFGGQAARAQAA